MRSTLAPLAAFAWIGLAGCLVVKSAGTSEASSASGAAASSGAGGASTASVAGAGGAGAPLEPFNAASTALDDRGVALVVVSDVSGVAGCALGSSLAAAPPGDGHVIAIRFQSDGGACAPGTYAIDPSCATHPFASFAPCAEYRKYAAGMLVARADAVSGSVTTSRSLEAGGACTVAITLGFGESGTYQTTFTVLRYDGLTPPLCDQAG